MPLSAVHHLRERLNSVPEGQEISGDLLKKYDAPVLAAAVKLWLLELEPPLGLYEAWDEFRKIYPSSESAYLMKIHGPLTLSVSSWFFDKDRAIRGTTFRGCGCGITEISQNSPLGIGHCPSTPQTVRTLRLAVRRLLLISEYSLIGNTKTEESDEVYISKLALAIGRGILRPKFENEKSIQDRHATSKPHILLGQTAYPLFDPSVVSGPYSALRSPVAPNDYEEETRIRA